MQTHLQYVTIPRRDTSGLPDFDEGGTSVTAFSYARRLATYLRDPSTIRVRTLEMFGRSPSIDDIKSLIPVKRVYIEEPEPIVIMKEAFNEPPPPEPKKVVQIPVMRSTPMRTIKEVITACGAPFNISYDDMVGSRRHAHIAKTRQFAFAVLRARNNSYPSAGKHMGGRDHSTAIHGTRQFFDRNIRDPVYLAAWMKLAPCKFKMVRTLEEFEMMTA